MRSFSCSRRVIQTFLKLYLNAANDAVRLHLFPFTLAGEAKAWLRSLEPSCIATWEDLRSKFLSRFFPPSKIEKLRADIRAFQQEEGETIAEAWERYKDLLNSCPSHGLTKTDQVQTFYHGLNYSSRCTLDSSAGGVFMYKTPTQGYNFLEDMLIHNIDPDPVPRLWRGAAAARFCMCRFRPAWGIWCRTGIRSRQS